MKRITLISLLFLAFFAESCKKDCVGCRQFKIYEGAPTGEFDASVVKQACGYRERRKYTKIESSGTDAGGKYNIHWECAFWEEDK